MLDDEDRFAKREEVISFSLRRQSVKSLTDQRSILLLQREVVGDVCRRTLRYLHTCGFAVLCLLLLRVSASAQTTQCIIPSDEIISDGSGPDSIPALISPEFVEATEGDEFLGADFLVVGIVVNGEARAYPHNVLWWHETINDFVGGKAVLVTFCPLTGSGLVFDPVTDDGLLQFANSGFLHDNNNVMFDMTARSLWTQMFLGSICGDFRGKKLKLLPVVQSTWEAWKALHPDTGVVSFNTGHARNYVRNPYSTYNEIDNAEIFSLIASSIPGCR